MPVASEGGGASPPKKRSSRDTRKWLGELTFVLKSISGGRSAKRRSGMRWERVRRELSTRTTGVRNASWTQTQVEWNRADGMEWGHMKWNGMEWGHMKWNGMVCTCKHSQSGMRSKSGSDWSGRMERRLLVQLYLETTSQELENFAARLEVAEEGLRGEPDMPSLILRMYAMLPLDEGVPPLCPELPLCPAVAP